MKPLALIASLLLLASSALGDTAEVTWEPTTLINGSPCVFRVRLPANLSSLSGGWLGKTVQFSFDPESGLWQGLAGIDLDTRPGGHPLTLDAVSEAGLRTAYRHEVPVAKGEYRVTALSVAKKFTEPDPETLRRIRREKRLKDRTFRLTTPERFWSGRFEAPAQTVTTGEFGSQRTFNGVRQSVHQGLDYRASIGTPVTAISEGQVILARDLFFEGGFLVLDHGQGLLSLYMHLSAFEVKEGDRVDQGQLIALSGGTGRSTGPHLHLGVRWQGVYVDPAILLRLSLPD